MKNVSKWVVAAADRVPSPASPLPIAGSSGAFDINVDQLLAALDAGQSSGTPPATGDASDTTSPLVERAHANASSSSGSVEKVVASRVAQAVTPIASRLEHLELVNKTMSIKLNEMIEKMTEAFTLQSSRMTLLESSVQVLLARSEEQDRAQKRILEVYAIPNGGKLDLRLCCSFWSIKQHHRFSPRATISSRARQTHRRCYHTRAMPTRRSRSTSCKWLAADPVLRHRAQRPPPLVPRRAKVPTTSTHRHPRLSTRAVSNPSSRRSPCPSTQPVRILKKKKMNIF